MLTIHLIGALRAQHVHPQNAFIGFEKLRRGATFARMRKQFARAYIDYSGNHVRPLKRPAHAHECIARVTAHRARQHAENLLAVFNDILKHLVARAADHGAGGGVLGVVVKIVDPLKGFRGHDFPGSARIFPGP